MSKPDQFAKLRELGTARMKAHGRWTAAVAMPGEDRSERAALWLGVMKADEEYHTELIRLMSDGAKPADVIAALKT